MYKVFESIDNLYNEIVEDKNWTGAESSFRNRYPLRFVLFENFADFNEFINECSNHNVFVQSMEGWMNEGYDDQLLTHSQLAKRFEEYVKSIPANDFVIAPFSEITRFYDNNSYTEFDSLLKTIRLIQSPEDAQHNHQRIYVPIIGMQGKMNRFKNDPNIHIWEYRSGIENQNYQLILTKGSIYGVNGLKNKYSLCANLREWISLWKDGTKVKKQIICSSKAIFNNARYAQPDNAFYYVICNNALEFLTKGLELNFGNTIPKEDELVYWEQLASYIDVDNFNFESFVNEKFNSFSLDDESEFVQSWFEHKDDFMRWLLKTIFLVKYSNQSYLGRVLDSIQSQSTVDLFSTLAVHIFEEPYNKEAIRQRLTILREAQKYGIQITESAEQQVDAKLRAMAADPERGCYYAMKYITPLTLSEKKLLIRWLGENRIDRDSVTDLFPELYYYTQPFGLQMSDVNLWVNSYFTEYCKAKVCNKITDTIAESIKSKNESPSSFELWRDNFKTVRTLLCSRTDIDIFYWIDGLGVDWIPFITKVIEKHMVDGIYLNEIHIASAELPTRTANNKEKLESLTVDELKKIGDIDSFAHTQKNYPDYIIEEFSKVEKAIATVLAQYNGKKIALISDHGISYLSGLASGLNIGGVKSDHAGRCAVCENGTISKDNNYIVMDDGKTICSLSHNSLTSKTPVGQGAHGGATPEEVLVPIFIISNQKNASTYSAKLLGNEISASSPVLRYTIKGISSIDIPTILYNGVCYSLHKISDNVYESEKLFLVETSTKITLRIGDFKQIDSLTIKTGVDEEDLFGGF